MSVGYAGVLPIRPVKRDNKDKPQLIETRCWGKIAVSGLGEYCAKVYLLRPKIINIIPPIPARRVSGPLIVPSREGNVDLASGATRLLCTCACEAPGWGKY